MEKSTFYLLVVIGAGLWFWYDLRSMRVRLRQLAAECADASEIRSRQDAALAMGCRAIVKDCILIGLALCALAARHGLLRGDAGLYAISAGILAINAVGACVICRPPQWFWQWLLKP
jgi:hypothetical protein